MNDHPGYKLINLDVAKLSNSPDYAAQGSASAAATGCR